MEVGQTSMNIFCNNTIKKFKYEEMNISKNAHFVSFCRGTYRFWRILREYIDSLKKNLMKKYRSNT